MTTFSDEMETRVRDNARPEQTRLDLVDPNATLPPDAPEPTRVGLNVSDHRTIKATPVRIGPGARFERYELDKLLGTGSFGRVFAARDTRLGRRVAIKILHPDQAEIPEIRQRF